MKRLIFTLLLIFQVISLALGGKEYYINEISPDAVSGFGSMEVLDSKYELILLPSWSIDFYNTVVKNGI